MKWPRFVVVFILVFVAFGSALNQSQPTRPMGRIRSGILMPLKHLIVPNRVGQCPAQIDLMMPIGVEATTIGDLWGHRTLSVGKGESFTDTGLSIVGRGDDNLSAGKVEIEAPKKSIYMIFMEGPAGKKMCFDMTISWGTSHTRLKPTVNFSDQGFGHLSFGIDPATKTYHFGNTKSWLDMTTRTGNSDWRKTTNVRKSKKDEKHETFDSDAKYHASNSASGVRISFGNGHQDFRSTV